MPVSESVVKNLILKSTPKTFDPIPTPLLVECLDTLRPSFNALVNSSLFFGVFPEVFKTALITPLLKKYLLTRMTWRTILLSPILPLSEKLVLSQFSDHLSVNNLYDCFQSAYQPGHSTETALLIIVNDLLLALDDWNVSLLALLDLSAASDTIDHSIPLHRLHHDFRIQGRPSTGFHPTLQTALSLSASIATHPSQLPSLSVFHRDQSLDLSSSFSIQLLFLL